MVEENNLVDQEKRLDYDQPIEVCRRAYRKEIKA